MGGRVRELMRLAARYGLSLHASHLPEDVRGYYSPSEARIYFDLSLTPFERIATIAHELGHAHHGHESSTPANERQADIFAARILIDPERYATVARHTNDREAIADVLGVTEDIVQVFEENCIARIGDSVYVTKRMRGNVRKFTAEGYG